MYKVLKPWKCL